MLRAELLGTVREIQGPNYPRVELSVNRSDSVKTETINKGARATNRSKLNDNVAKPHVLVPTTWRQNIAGAAYMTSDAAKGRLDKTLKWL